mmetsp:Transcript_68995/g.194580  ORF Transcript_68995/g.194580 Transcript_68995/m.194580 type:complete len:323 (+) Transcript_68995:45-1013(+)|eukprot:CAMPEP_0179353294 /NCGR_PEP_ID=MMETSP0797-20121207/76251_1 /TAXON_ID=47934 /ORGANISM="Dinophysis acuminata, Strain DAEP01" /LENGTH=322 /DNA_ID=CAMNT_0021068341 /DNA_START=45 /DNA_END=1013 /DNA_ORIENTATION=+
MSEPAVVEAELSALPPDLVPERLTPSFYFDFEAHPFEHEELFKPASSVVDVLERIHGYINDWLQTKYENPHCAELTSLPNTCKVVGGRPCILGDPLAVFSPDVLIGALGGRVLPPGHAVFVGPGVQVLGGTFDIRGGGIDLGECAVVEPGAHIAGPAIIGPGTVLRSGAYVRGDAIVGGHCVLRGELKNVVIMDHAELAHPSYAGDSIIGHRGHFGCQAVTANLGLFGGELSVDLPVAEEGVEGAPASPVTRYKLGRQKMGVVLGDGGQLGCSAVADPGTLLGPRTHVYPLTRLCSGCYGPDEIIKNKPMESGVVTREPMRS